MDHPEINHDNSNKFDIVSNLPYEIAHMIFHNLDGTDLLRASSVCHKWYDITSLDSLWKKKCHDEEIQAVDLAHSSPRVRQFFTQYTSYWKAVFARKKKIHGKWIDHSINNWTILIPSNNLSVKKVYHMDERFIILDYELQTNIHVLSTIDQRLLYVFETGMGNLIAWALYKEKFVVFRVSSSLINVWDFTTGQRLLSIDSLGEVSSIRICDTLIIAGYWDGAIRTFDSTSGANISNYLTQESSIVVTLDYDSKDLLVWGNMDTKIFMWNITTNEFLYTLTQHSGMVADVKFVDNYMVSCSTDEQVGIWNKLDGTLLHVIIGIMNPLIHLNNKKFLAHTSWPVPGIRMWDLVTGQCLLLMQETVRISRFCVNDKYVIAINQGTIGIWNIFTGRKFRTLRILNNAVSDIRDIKVTETKLLYLGVNKYVSKPNNEPKFRNIISLMNFDV